MSISIARPALAGIAATLALVACADVDPTGPDDARNPFRGAASLAPGAVCVEMPIRVDTELQRRPVVSGNLIVWEDRRSSEEDLYGYDLTTGQEVEIVLHQYPQRLPALSGNHLAWWDARNDGADIYVLDLTSGQETRLTPPSFFGVVDPAVSGDVVVWQDNRNSPSPWVSQGDIYAHDLATGQELRITTGPTTESQPDVSGDIIVWRDLRSSNADIWAHDLSTGQQWAITTDPAGQSQPSISGDIIVWTDGRNGAGDIYAYDLAAGREIQLTDDPANEVTPVVSDGVVVFVRATGGSGDIIALDIATGVETPITNDLVDQREPDIDGGVIVWRQQGDIYAAVCSNPTDPVQAVGDLEGLVETLGPDGDGTLNAGQTNALTRKLAQALRLLDRGQTDEAMEVLLAFRQQVLDLEAEGVLGASDAEGLVAAVDAIVEALGSS